MGVSSAGTADRSALQAANHLVGNAETTAGLESFGGGTKLRFTGAGVAAVTGAYGAITVTADDGTCTRTTSARPSHWTTGTNSNSA